MVLVITATTGMLLAGCASAVPSRPTVVRTEVTLTELCSESSGPAVAPGSITALGRSSKLYAPANYQPGSAAPLLVSLHPFILTPSNWEAYSGLAKAAAARGYWVLLPRGSDPGPRWAVPGGIKDGPDDIAWIDALIVETSKTVCIEPSRVFAAGFSAGAAMSVGLSCELPWRFNAIAASGGSNLTSLCPTSGATDALILHGDKDPIAPVTGNTIPFTPPVGLTVDQVVSSFATRNGCAPAPTATPVTNTTTADRYSCGSNRLEYWRMRGAGHTWAGSPIPLDIVTGPTDRTFSANDAVLDFFGAP